MLGVVLLMVLLLPTAWERRRLSILRVVIINMLILYVLVCGCMSARGMLPRRHEERIMGLRMV